MTRTFLIFLVAIMAASCGNKNTTTSSFASNANYEVQYAQGFKVVKTAEYTHITVNNPWDTTAVLQSYILVDKKESYLTTYQ